MIADRLTKALLKQKFNNFVMMIGIVDIGERLRVEKQMEILKDDFKVREGDDENKEIIARLIYKILKIASILIGSKLRECVR